MADNPTSTTFIFVDRRRTGRGKSLNNRQRLLKRVRDSIRKAKPVDIDAGGVKKASSSSGGGAGGYTNPVSIAKDALIEPTFHYAAGTGRREVVLIGNKEFLKGDEFPMGGGGGSGRGNGKGAGQGDGEDDFIINISRDEFYDVFFEDCELPDMLETHDKDTPEHTMQRAGHKKSGNPSQLSVIRSFKLAKARRITLTASPRQELEELEAELAELTTEDHEPESVDAWALRMQEITLRIAELRDKIAAVPLFEDLDLRYRKSEKVQVKSASAVFAMLMDISGSMDETKKRLARKLFALQYAFIMRKYPGAELIFIAHTEEAEEMSEEDFFTTRKSGGTVVSPAWELLHTIIKARYDARLTNIYVSYAGDGDNWEDNSIVIGVIKDTGLLAKLRHLVYAEIGSTFGSGLSLNSLWTAMQSLSNSNPKVATARINSDSDVFDSFKTIYRRRTKKATT